MMIVISIPYGAIKSFNSVVFITLFFFISIPYGAIKSIYVDDVEVMQGDFNSLWCD